MKAFIISDKDYKTDRFNELDKLVCTYLKDKNFEIEHTEIGKGDLNFCMGCFGCWIKKPGECVIKDQMAQINEKCMNSDVVVYISPVVFGQFSANIKNAIDRWLPNMLPFFTTRPDGSTIHPARYSTYPMQIIIGYGDNVSMEDAQLFTDITKKHRRNIECFVYQNNNTDITERLDRIKLERVGGQL